MKFKSLKNLEDDIKKHLLPKLPRDIKAVYGVPRSGMIPASIISTFLGTELGMVGNDSRRGITRIDNVEINGDKILLVDDSILSGKSMTQAKKEMKENCITCAVYANSHNTHLVDYFGVVIDGQRFFEWNFQGRVETPQYMFDLDGVLCVDPDEFDDDGIKYENAIRNAQPLYLPQTKIKAICTNRIERWRSLTEEWLKQYNVKYETLIMQQYKTAVERRTNSNPAIYKAEQYKKSSSILFIESSETQAIQIAQMTKKPVLSIETMRLL